MKAWAGLLLLCAAAWGAETQTWYVQATKAELRKEPRVVGAVVARLRRGDMVAVINRKDLWFDVRTGKAEGWIPRLFLSEHAPVGVSELMNLPSSTTLEKASRRRPASFSVSASTRGLMISERTRRGQEQYPTDYEALIRMEEWQLDPAKLESFRTSAKLPD